MIKSGGEWISSVAIENHAAAHPAVARAAVIAVPHPRWTERPRLFVQLRPDMVADAANLRGRIGDRGPSVRPPARLN